METSQSSVYDLDDVYWFVPFTIEMCWVQVLGLFGTQIAAATGEFQPSFISLKEYPLRLRRASVLSTSLLIP